MFLLWLITLCVTILSLAGGAFLWLTVRRAINHSREVETYLRVLQGDIAVLSACQADALERDQVRERHLEKRMEKYTRTIEGRLEAMEQRLRQITRRQDEQLHTGDPGETSYGAAIRLAHQGANVEQLVNTFGLSRGEAELIAALHRAKNEQA
ncbi:conserved hypothetical protein [Gammaproteobacteria bacterium]